MTTFLAGLAYPFQALGQIRRTPQIWAFVLLPIAVNIVLGLFIYTGLLIAGAGWIESVTAGLPAWAGGIEWLLRGILAITLFVALGYVLVRFGVILGSPFYGQLSERLEQHLTGHAPPATPLTPTGVARDLWRAVLYELKKLALTLAVIVPLFAIGFIPVAGQVIAIAGQIMLGMLIACLDFLDSPLERRRLRFRDKLAIVRAHLPASAGFGIVCFGLVSIPLINLLAIPLCVTAGTLFFCERIHDAARSGDRR